MARDRTLNLRIDQALAEEIEARARTKGLTKSEWVTRALTYALLAKNPTLRITTITQAEL